MLTRNNVKKFISGACWHLTRLFGMKAERFLFNFLTAICVILIILINILGSKYDIIKLLGVDFSPGSLKVIRRTDTKLELTEKLHFLSNYKNPCWLETDVESRAKLKCLPYYFVIGVPKCGTTDLCKRITLHPLVSDRVVKGNHWLTRYRYGKFPALSNYLQLFEYAVESDIKGITTETGFHNAVFGDCTPSISWNSRHMFIEARRRNMSGEPSSNANVLKHLNPKSKIIAILRNPVDRLYSEYLFFNGNQNNPGEFHRRALYAVNNMTQCLNTSSLRRCVYFDRVRRKSSFKRADQVRLQVGIYHVFLEDFLNVFHREQIFIIKLEKYSKQINETLQKVFTFLDIGNITDPVLLKNISASSPLNTRSDDDTRVGNMLPETRKLLANFYKPYNERLAKLLGKEFDYNQN